jgi:hypothetical protein
MITPEKHTMVKHESSYFNKSRKTRKCLVSNSDLELFETNSRHRSDDLEEVGEHMARNTCGAGWVERALYT